MTIVPRERGWMTRLSDKAENGEGTEKERRDFCRAFGREKPLYTPFSVSCLFLNG